jgi:histidine ammonia-lyase
MTAHESGLPAFLVRESGVNSGLMMAHVTAAALTSEMKTLAHPAAVDSIPTSAGREDHVSMSMWAALKAWRAVELATSVVAIELLAACQGIDLLRPLRTAPRLEDVHRAVRADVPRWDVDRSPAPDMARVAELIGSGAIERACGDRLA